jgi:hypothetical protein
LAHCTSSLAIRLFSLILLVIIDFLQFFRAAIEEEIQMAKLAQNLAQTDSPLREKICEFISLLFALEPYALEKILPMTLDVETHQLLPV